MNRLEQRLSSSSPNLYSAFEKTKVEVSKLLQQYVKNFPTYTDHSIEHTEEVLSIAADLLTPAEIQVLNDEEVYILMMACILHDVGMCIPEAKIKEIRNTDPLIEYRSKNEHLSREEYLRDIHHILSKDFILTEWRSLHIATEKYAQAIALVAQGHRKVNLNDFELYDPHFFVKRGREFVCLPYLSCVLRISDELDVSNLRTPSLLLKYYIPDNDMSRKEWEKHKSTIQVNFKKDKVIVEAKCTDYNILGALEEQFDKIRGVIHQCQKTIRNIPVVESREYKLSIIDIEPKFLYENFDPKGIKYSFEVKNVINAFVGEDLYDSTDVAIREAVQNAIDACTYKQSIQKTNYKPLVTIEVQDDFIAIEDNGQGMDEFIIENYFGRLASSFYEQDVIKDKFDAIGQFGIGVFSYFLIGEYIDVETKRQGKHGLKFRTDKDPNGYFHFFESFNRDFEGTRLIIHLKESFKGKFTLSIVNDYLSRTFPFITIPLIVKKGNEEWTVRKESFKLSIEENIKPHLYYRSKNMSNVFELLTTSFKNQNFEGVAGIVAPTNMTHLDIKLEDHFDGSSYEYTRSHNRSKCKIAQKGVLINHYSSAMDHVYAKVDIKKKLKVNLSRNDFRDEDALNPIFETIELRLVQLFFNKAKKELDWRNDEHVKVTEFYLLNYGFPFYLRSKKFIEKILRFLCFETFVGKEKKYRTLEDVIKDSDKGIVMLVHGEETMENKEWLSIMVSGRLYWVLAHILHRVAGLKEVIVKQGEIKHLFGFMIVDKNWKLPQSVLLKHRMSRSISFCEFLDIRLIAMNYWETRDVVDEDTDSLMDDVIKVNVEHPVIRGIIEGFIEKTPSQMERRLVDEFFNMLNDYIYEKFNGSKAERAIDEMNSVLNVIQKEGHFSIPLLSSTDFH